MKKKISGSILALLLCAALTSAAALPAFASFQYPSAYWPLHSAWEQAVSAGSLDQVISVAQQTYDLLNPLGLCSDVCGNLETKCAKASWACEIKGDLNGAVTWLERQRTFAQWLDQNGNDRYDTLRIIEARLNQLQAAKSPALYALTDQPGNSYSSSGAPVSGTLYGSAVTASRDGESAVLMYVPFGDSDSVAYWIDYYKDSSPVFQKAAEEGGVIELAWNFQPESTAGAQAVLSADSYIAESLAAMGALNATVLLRPGAEMNVWAESDPAVYIQAFQKIAKAADKYNNIKMVFSPNSIDNWGVKFADYYPGDQYVDWIGMSDYHSTNNAAYGSGTASYDFRYEGFGADAFYGQGLYDSNPLVTIAPIARFAQEHNKPMMISECGFGYRDNTTGADQTAYAVDQLTKYYAYVNMVYPQVKAVFLFNTTLPGSRYPYTLADSPALNAAYTAALAANGAYLSQGQTSGKTWKELKNAELENASTVRLAAYAPLPGQSAVSVQYFVDDKPAAAASKAPYYFELNGASLAAGRHTIRAEITSGQFKVSTPAYTLYFIGGGMKTEMPNAGFDMNSASSWALDLLTEAAGKNLITARTKNNLRQPITRLQFAELAVNLIEKTAGKSVTPSSQLFADTSDPMALKAVAAGVASGRGERTFAPDASITRQEICLMLSKAVQYIEQDKGVTALSNTSTQIDSRFQDAGQVASWAAAAVAQMTNNGLMTGDQNGRINPASNTTVEQAIVMILAAAKRF